MKTPSRKDRAKALAMLKSLQPDDFIPEINGRGNGVYEAVKRKLKELKNGQSLKFDLDLFGQETLYRVVRELNKSAEYVKSRFHTTKYAEKNCIYIWLNQA